MVARSFYPSGKDHIQPAWGTPVGVPGSATRYAGSAHMPTVLVTGNAGFIGSHLTERLLALGDYCCACEILESSMILGENAYDIVPGWMGTPTCSFADHLLSPERMKARGDRTDIGTGPKNDEELLVRFVEDKL